MPYSTSTSQSLEGSKSISDDDLCATCKNCQYKPGEMSSCSLNWPGDQDSDYVQKCADYTFDPAAGFPSPDAALRLIYQQTSPMTALLALVKAQVDFDECGFASEVVRDFNSFGGPHVDCERDGHVAVGTYGESSASKGYPGLDLGDVSTVIDCANSYLQDIESGIEDGTYLASENKGLPVMQEAVVRVEQWYRHTRMTTPVCNQSHNASTVQIGNFNIEARIDPDGHLTLWVKDTDGSAVITIDEDVAATDTEFAVRLTTRSIEDRYLSGQI